MLFASPVPEVLHKNKDNGQARLYNVVWILLNFCIGKIAELQY
jgi:hypothetical protein